QDRSQPADLSGPGQGLRGQEGRERGNSDSYRVSASLAPSFTSALGSLGFSSTALATARTTRLQCSVAAPTGPVTGHGSPHRPTCSGASARASSMAPT